jgi:inorganic pyrophosphatase/exopolyphosphatase
MAATKSFFTFLRQSRALAASAPRVHAIVGNESCDADSIVSALTYAWYLHLRGNMPADTAILPLVPCDPQDFALRREAGFLLQRAADAAHDLASPFSGEPKTSLQWVADQLAFFDKPQLEGLQKLSSSSALSLTLVDHNALVRPLRDLVASDRVVRIVDHHVDAKQHLHVTGEDRRISYDLAAGRGVGSTCTLVAQSLFSLSGAETGSEAAAVAIDAGIAELLLGVILLDTLGLSPSAGKTTPEDAAVVERLKAIIVAERADKAEVDVSLLSKRLLGLREDLAFWRSLTPSEGLRFDYKAFEGPAARPSDKKGVNIRIGTSSYMAPLTCVLSGWNVEPSFGLAEGEGAATGTEGAAVEGEGQATVQLQLDAPLAHALRAYAEVQGCSYLFLMSSTTVPSLNRQIAIIHAPNAGGDALTAEDSAALLSLVTSHLQSESAGLKLCELQVKPVEGVNISVRLFVQGNIRASRKQIVPMILATLAGTVEA